MIEPSPLVDIASAYLLSTLYVLSLINIMYIADTLFGGIFELTVFFKAVAADKEPPYIPEAIEVMFEAMGIPK